MTFFNKTRHSTSLSGLAGIVGEAICLICVILTHPRPTPALFCNRVKSNVTSIEHPRRPVSRGHGVGQKVPVCMMDARGRRDTPGVPPTFPRPVSQSDCDRLEMGTGSSGWTSVKATDDVWVTSWFDGKATPTHIGVYFREYRFYYQ